MKNLTYAVLVFAFSIFTFNNSYAQEEAESSSYKLIKKGLFADVMLGNATVSSKNFSE